MLRSMLGLFLLAGTFTCYSGVEIGGSRVIYNGEAKQASMSVTNPDDRPYLIQSWVDKNPSAGDGDNTFITTPPLFRLEPHSQNSVRIVYTGKPLATDRGSMLWLSIKSVPSTSRDDANRLFITDKSVFKLFYRPPGLRGYPARAYESIIFSRRNGRNLVSNPTPYHISFYELAIGNFRVITLTTLEPLMEKEITVPVNAGSSVTGRALNDSGGVTDG